MAGSRTSSFRVIYFRKYFYYRAFLFGCRYLVLSKTERTRNIRKKIINNNITKFLSVFLMNFIRFDCKCLMQNALSHCMLFNVTSTRDRCAERVSVFSFLSYNLISLFFSTCIPLFGVFVFRVCLVVVFLLFVFSSISPFYLLSLHSLCLIFIIHLLWPCTFLSRTLRFFLRLLIIFFSSLIRIHMTIQGAGVEWDEQVLLLTSFVAGLSCEFIA